MLKRIHTNTKPSRIVREFRWDKSNTCYLDSDGQWWNGNPNSNYRYHTITEEKAKERLMPMVFQCCLWNDVRGVSDVLKQCPELVDLYEKNGGVFTVAISKDSVELLRTLIEFYEDTKLQGDPSAREYKVALHNLREMIETALEQSGKASEEIREITSKYIVEPVYSDAEDSDFNDADKYMQEGDVTDTATMESDSSVSTLTSSSLQSLTCHPWLYDIHYKYWKLNTAAERAYWQAEMVKCDPEKSESYEKDCHDKITSAMLLVARNNNQIAHAEHKAVVIYNYLKFTDSKLEDVFSHVVTKSREGFVHYILPQILHTAEHDDNQTILDDLHSFETKIGHEIMSDELSKSFGEINLCDDNTLELAGEHSEDY